MTTNPTQEMADRCGAVVDRINVMLDALRQNDRELNEIVERLRRPFELETAQ